MRFFKQKLFKEISLALLLKILLLTLLWFLCFRHPFTDQASFQQLTTIFQTHFDKR